MAGTLARFLGGRLHASPSAPGSAPGWATLRLPAGPAETVPGQGSSRDARPEPARAGVRSAPGPTLADVCVLIVDDRADMREVISGLLELEGAAVTGCASAAEAIDRHAAWASGSGLRLILSDLSMPGMDGLALMRVLRARERSQHLPRTPAVALTAQPDDYSAETVARAGYDLLLGKPVKPAELGLRLSCVVHGAIPARGARGDA